MSTESIPEELPPSAPPAESVENRRIADLLERVADLLAAQDASAFRVHAYRHAAHELRRLGEPLRHVFREGGLAGLDALPGIGPSIAAALAGYLENGQLDLLRRLEGQQAPEELFATLPGIGHELARRIHHDLGVESLEELELAAHDGRLAQVPGFGARRVTALRDLLASRLGRSLERRARHLDELGGPAGETRAPLDPGDRAPSVAALLSVDAEYRRRAARGELHRIAPRRFNPTHQAWLPIWHTERDGWHITALYSNTALAHQLKTTHDWVVVYADQGGHDAHFTVVTERRPPLAGLRVVRGRESECLRLYANRHASSAGRADAQPST